MGTVSRALTSSTTQTVAGSTFVGGGVLAGLFAFLRAAFPEKLPWSVETDAELVVLLSTVVIPILSRMVASVRGKLKRLKHIDRAGVAFLLCIALALGAVSCTTTQTLPDGTIVVTTPDWSAIYSGVEAALAQYERIEARRDAARDAGDAERAARLDAILAAIADAVERAD